ncbi:ABC transporter [Candidatus Izimaplasma bacterium ZiA1]|uniref:ABC transporter ATP-binding protein n=1 Tax=Candidatus Izimoplasma sp. ZiA1 TaxID=2024899 RepID=UPI000BAA8082|nr:ABC transporter [Candidatus Izimaplasma bacterium ZiA1]
MKAIEIKNLVKTYDDVVAVKKISFDVEHNSFFAFLGPNGAGKSTTINIISTLLDYNSGTVRVYGNELSKNDSKIRDKIGVVFQQSMLDGLLTVIENLEIRSSFYGISKANLMIRLDEINEFIEIKPFLHQRYATLSGGQRRKADIARALINWPEILILDEPTTGLDPKSRKDIWRLINKLRTDKNVTIFLTTHYMEEVKDANKVVIINDGEIVAEGSSEELRDKYSSDRVKMIPKNGLEDKLNNDGIDFYIVNNTVNVNLENAFAGIDFVNKYKENIKDFEIIRGDMDDVFLNITGRKLVNY